jgi:hypothetical protein
MTKRTYIEIGAAALCAAAILGAGGVVADASAGTVRARGGAAAAELPLSGLIRRRATGTSGRRSSRASSAR